MIYLDHQATTPVDPRVLEAMVPALTGEAFANASSTHSAGVRARRLLDDARASVASAFPPGGRRVVFTSGATEANAIALLGLAPKGRRRHVVVSAIEHPSVLETARELERRGCELTVVEPDGQGIVSADAVLESVTDRTALAAVMLVNNEVGTVQPVGEIAARLAARAPGCVLHVDAAQAPGLVDLAPLRGAGSVAISGHKLHGPKGVGALLLAPDVRPRPLWYGGGHEGGLRSGTVPVALVAGLARALALALDGWQGAAARIGALRDQLVSAVLAGTPGARLVGHPTLRSPANASIAVSGVTGDALVGALDQRGVIASTGSACRAGDPRPSHVLEALGLGGREAGVVRLGLGRTTTADEVEAAARAFIEAARELRPEDA